MRKNIDSGIGTYMELLAISKMVVSHETLALCWLDFVFMPKLGSEQVDKTVKFTNIYGYRATRDGTKAGWELVIRDGEANAMREITS